MQCFRQLYLIVSGGINCLINIRGLLLLLLLSSAWYIAKRNKAIINYAPTYYIVEYYLVFITSTIVSITTNMIIVAATPITDNPASKLALSLGSGDDVASGVSCVTGMLSLGTVVVTVMYTVED